MGPIPTSVEELCQSAGQVCAEVANAPECHVTHLDIVDIAGLFGATGGYRAEGSRILFDVRQADALASLFDSSHDAIPLEDVVDAVATLSHEHIHALGPSDRGPAGGFGLIWRAQRSRNPGPLSFEEGVTELWTELTLAEFLRRTRLLEIQPKLQEVEYVTAYGVEVEAVRAVAAKLGSLTARSEYEVVRMMAREMPDTRSAAVADSILASKGLSEHPDNLAMASTLERSIDGLFDFLNLTSGLERQIATHRISEAIDSLERDYDVSSEPGG
jgi:hypothetical protein